MRRRRAMYEAALLMFRVWRLHRKTGLPYQPLLDAHLEILRLKVEMIEQIAWEQQQVVYEREAARQATRN